VGGCLQTNRVYAARYRHLNPHFPAPGPGEGGTTLTSWAEVSLLCGIENRSRYLVGHHRKPRRVVDTTRSHAAEHELDELCRDPRRDTGTAPALDAKHLTLMVGRPVLNAAGADVRMSDVPAVMGT
jgi:hypothetical protein